ncbi:hypothetical protein HAV_00065 [Candidatus Hepatincola sp. Av]
MVESNENYKNSKVFSMGLWFIVAILWLMLQVVVLRADSHTITNNAINKISNFASYRYINNKKSLFC